MLVVLVAFFGSLLALGLLGQTQLSWYVFGFHGLVLLGMSRYIRWRTASRYPVLLIAWLSFLASLGLSLIFTHSIALSIDGVAHYVLGATAFWTVLLFSPGERLLISSRGNDVQQQDRERELIPSLFIWGALGMVLVLVGFHFFFLKFPIWSGLLPGMNLVYSTYGHNHLASLLLIIIPAVWWLYYREGSKSKLSIMLAAILVVLYLALLTSFGRVTIFIGFLQLLAVIWGRLDSNWRKDLRQSQPVKVLLDLRTIGVFLFLLALASSLFLSSMYYFRDDHSCPLPVFRNQLCKSFQTESRPLYWVQALEAIGQYPLFGYGPGTFSLISTRYKQLPYVGSGYAHNDFLQIFSESGVLAGAAFVSLVAVMFAGIFATVRSSQDVSSHDVEMLRYLLIAMTGSVGNAFFDFDWHFTAVWIVFLIVVALAIRCSRSKKELKVNPIFTRYLVAFSTFLLISLLSGVIIIGALFSYVDVLVRIGDAQRAFQIFPYFSAHMRRFITSEQIQKQDLDRLSQYYRFHPDWYEYHRFVQGNSPEAVTEKEVQQLEQVFVIDPWQRERHQTYNYYIDQNRLEDAEVALEQHAAFILNTNSWVEEFEDSALYKPSEFGFSYKGREEAAQAFADLADIYITQQNASKAGQLFAQAHELDRWMLTKRTLDLKSLFETRTTHHFIQYFPVRDTKQLGEAVQAITDALYLSLEEYIILGQPEAAIDAAEQIVHMRDWEKYLVWELASQLFQEAIAQDLSRGDILSAQKNVQAWRQLVLESGPISEIVDLDDGHREALARDLVTVGNKSIGRGEFIVGQNYAQAFELVPWVFWRSEYWLDDKSQWQLDKEVMFFADGILSTQILEGQNWEADRSLKLLQLAADAAVREGEYNQARDYLAQMANLDSYWARVQLGNFYLLQNKDQSARNFFENCLAQDLEHTDCKIGIAILNGHWDNRSRYHQVSKIILGEAVWQDFAN